MHEKDNDLERRVSVLEAKPDPVIPDPVDLSGILQRLAAVENEQGYVDVLSKGFDDLRTCVAVLGSKSDISIPAPAPFSCSCS